MTLEQYRLLVAGTVLLAALHSGAVVRATVQAPPQAATGKKLQAQDGDVVLINGAARVRAVRRHEAQVRAIHDPAERWVVLMVDYAPAPGTPPDGGVDTDYTFHDVTAWPLGEIWFGVAVIDEYSFVGEGAAAGIGLRTESGLVQVLSPGDQGRFGDPTAVTTVTYRGMGRGGGGGASFAVEETRLRAQASRNAQMRGSSPGGPPVTRSSLGMSMVVTTPGMAASAAPRDPNQPVRVGGNIPPPRKLVDVAPVMPDAAVKAGLAGLVILEVVIGPDGRVTDVRVLKSIPLLDEAAITAVRGWRYEPTELNGVPVPVIMTVPVRFP